ncbi:MAG: hypothetical protein QM820_45805 [Minicystis sp.]
MNKLWWIVAMGVVVGCGSSSTTGGGGEGGGSSGNAGLCPATQPKAGDTCTAPAGHHCTYGDSPQPLCRADFTCGSGAWALAQNDCSHAPDVVCNTVDPGAACSDNSGYCDHGTSICLCYQGPPQVWQCTSPPTTAGCPEALPNDGTACSKEGLACPYGLLCTSNGVLVTCTQGAWRWDASNGGCPN